MTTDYRIIEAEGYDRLEREVKKRMKEGWEPLGGITSPAKTAHRSRHRRVAQALVKTGTSTLETVTEEPDTQPETEDESEDDLTDLSVSDLKDEIADVSDLDTLSDYIEAEKANKNRKTAKSAIEGRIAELTAVSEPENKPDNSGQETTEDGYVKSD